MNLFRILSVVVALLVALPAVCAAKVKLATLAPTGSSYYKSLLAMREAWRKISGGAIDLVIYGDGKLGGEADTVGLMAVNSIQASMLTTVGLSDIEKGVAGLQSIPMGFNDFAEVDYVGAKLQLMLDQQLLKKGFVVLFWTDAGWVRIFTKKPVVHPADLKPMKLFTWAGSPDEVTIYRSAGFNPVALETADILPGLQTGLIDAAPMPPIFALLSQVDMRAPYMLEINYAPLVGACVIRKESWESFPAGIRGELLKVAQAAGQEIKQNGRKEGEESVQAMQKRGLKVTKVTPEIEAEWRAMGESVYPQIRARVVPEDVFDQALKFIKEYRADQHH
jgi:TRAP-type C4-dicarboxylate transport system substrate-binding protein